MGTPAEENGGGKAKLIDAGAYKNVDISLMAYVYLTFLFTDHANGLVTRDQRSYSRIKGLRMELPER